MKDVKGYALKIKLQFLDIFEQVFIDFLKICFQVYSLKKNLSKHSTCYRFDNYLSKGYESVDALAVLYMVCGSEQRSRLFLTYTILFHNILQH